MKLELLLQSSTHCNQGTLTLVHSLQAN